MFTCCALLMVLYADPKISVGNLAHLWIGLRLSTKASLCPIFRGPVWSCGATAGRSFRGGKCHCSREGNLPFASHRKGSWLELSHNKM
jgi:hypothetical protein